MKIARIRATPVNIPLEAPFWWTGGLYPGTSKAIVEVETDEGLVGLGEAPSTDVCPMIIAMGEALAGKDPLDIAACERVCVPPWQIVQNTDDARVVKAFGAIEIALWDLRGKAWGQPLSTLIGGKARDSVAFSEYFAFREGREMTPEAVVDYCVKMRDEHGSTIFEGKLIRGDPLLEIETVRRLRAALGRSAEIRLDSNMQWSLSTARRVLRMLADYDISNYEDPVATFEEMAALRQHSDIPFSTHVPDLRRAVALGAPDTIVTNFAVLGGIGRTLRFIGACEAMGVGYWCYSGETGVGTAAYLHVSAATPWISEASQSLFRWQIGDVIEGGPFRQVDNVVSVPSEPGLGVTLDRAALKVWNRHFVEHGPLDQGRRDMIDGSSTTPARERGVRARHQRDARRTHALISGIERQIPTYELLGEEGLVRIEAAVDTILQEIGIEFRGDEEALRLWRGASADVEGDLVRQLARRLGLPLRCSGAFTSAKIADGQAMQESTMSMLAAVQSGAHFILHAAGWLEGGLTMGYEKLIMDADFCAALHVWMGGLRLDDNQLALDAFREVGPGKHFFGSAHTLANYETAFWDSAVADNNSFEQWRDEGMKDAPARAAERCKRLLAEYQPPKLDPGIEEELVDFVQRRKAERPDQWH